jgi:thiamine biosynthesis lipoprotein
MTSAVENALCALLLLGVIASSSCSGPERELLMVDGETMGTTWSAQFVSEDPEHKVERADLQALYDALNAELIAVNQQMSTYIEDSEISRFNASTSTEWFAVSLPLAVLVDQAIEIGRKADGLYDVTVAPLVELWGFGAGPDHGRTEVPKDAAIEAALRNVGLGNLEVRLDPPALKKQIPGLRIDLSSIAKGYGVDRLGAVMEASGYHIWFVEIGGEIRASGEKAKGQPWRVGIERPTSGERVSQRLIDLRDAAVATSGNYRNFFESGGQSFAHTIGPRSGRPVMNTAASVTVVAVHCATADAWATALMALGAERGIEIAEREGIAALFLLPADGGRFEERVTSAFHDFGRANP